MTFAIAAYIKKTGLQRKLKKQTAAVITNSGYLECIICVQYTAYNARWRNNALQAMLCILFGMKEALLAG